MQHLFDIDIATKFGINIAVFLKNIAFWTQNNIANRKNYNEGRYWTYNTVKAFSELFPYWTPKQIRTIIVNCIEHNLLIAGNFNKTKYDQTKWYALTDQGLELFNINTIKPKRGVSCPNGKMDFDEKANGIIQKGKPIPDNKQDNKQDNKYICHLPRIEFEDNDPEQDSASINKKEIKNPISDLKKSQKENKLIPIQQMIDVYHELLPECPKVKIIGSDFERQLKTLQRRWPEISSNKEKFSLEGFKRFILFIKEKGFLIFLLLN